MNFLGHPFVAYKITGRLNPWLVAGSHLPDLVPFVPDSVFSFEEIHESGELFLKFLKKNYPEANDLALGIISHSVKYGADAFNRKINDWLLGGNQSLRRELASEIVACSGVSMEIAEQSRMHNYLWMGVDLYLLKNESVFLRRLRPATTIVDWQKVAALLSEFYEKDFNKVNKEVSYFLKHQVPTKMTSLDGLVSIWSDVLAGLPEGDRIDKPKTTSLFIKISRLFNDQWQKILTVVIEDVCRRMTPFL